MGKLRIQKDILEQARERSNLSDAERANLETLLPRDGAKGQTAIDLAAFPVAFLKALLDDSRLTPNQRASVSMQVHGMSGDRPDQDEVYSTRVGNAVEFGSTFATLGVRTPNCEMFLNGRWYPIILNVEFLKNENNISKSVNIHAQLSLCEFRYQTWRHVYSEIFLDESGGHRERTVLEVLQHFGFRKLQMPALEFNLKLLRAERASQEMGQVVHVCGPVVRPTPYAWWSRLESQTLGTKEWPRRGVVEQELEVAQEQRDYYAPYGQSRDGLSRLPFVRVFSLDTKAYLYADVDDVAPYEFDTGAMKRLQLPREMLSILTSVFSTPVESMFGDVIAGKHGGLVILASGNPGVGKTLTAEVYAEQTNRPLYVLELGELGTNVAQVEENLGRVFTRVARWNAVLQFDECEIFLTERGEDLERSAIVGIFLRLLDYYRGILFLTTNRPQVLDHAVMSRVMLRLDYPDLTVEARAAIWQTMFETAGMTLTEGTFAELGQAMVNGRQIRNLTRLARILYPDRRVTLAQLRHVLHYGSTAVQTTPAKDVAPCKVRVEQRGFVREHEGASL